MTRFHATNNGSIPFTQAEEDEQDLIDQYYINGAGAKEKACEQITAHRHTKYEGVMPMTISSGTFNYPYSEMLVMANFNRFQAITAGVMTCPTYWRDEDNNNNSVVVGDFLIMAESANTYISNFATRAHTDKTAINAASTKAEIDSIVDAYLAYDGL